jgi:hypothetical protein
MGVVIKTAGSFQINADRINADSARGTFGRIDRCG